MVLPDQVRGMHVKWGYPFVFAFWKALPFDQILQPLLLAEIPMSQNVLDFLLFFFINQIRRRAREVRSVYRRFMIGR